MKQHRTDIINLLEARGVDTAPLALTITSAAMTAAVIDKLFEGLMKLSDFRKVTTGSMGQMKEDAHPLLLQYVQMMKLYHQQLRTLGLMNEEAGDDEDLMMTFLNGIGK